MYYFFVTGSMLNFKIFHFCITFHHFRFILTVVVIWALTRGNLSSGVWEQQRRRPACASAQTDQRLCYSLFGKYDI